ncbi:hypothetical protein PENTCL1PPCAC_7614, partial [Pristionchus entomophagus]
CTFKVRLIYAIVGICFGIMAGTCYGIMFQNVSATSMAFVSSIFAATSFYIHLAYKKKWMNNWTDSKWKSLFYINLILFIIATAGMAACCILAGINHQGFTYDDLMGENLWMTAVWCFITAKWTGMSAYYARWYLAKVKAASL